MILIFATTEISVTILHIIQICNKLLIKSDISCSLLYYLDFLEVIFKKQKKKKKKMCKCAAISRVPNALKFDKFLYGQHNLLAPESKLFDLRLSGWVFLH